MIVANVLCVFFLLSPCRVMASTCIDLLRVELALGRVFLLRDTSLFFSNGISFVVDIGIRRDGWHSMVRV